MNRIPRGSLVASVALAVALLAAGWPSGAALAAPVRVAHPASRVKASDLPTLDPGELGSDPVDTLSYDLGDTAFQPDGFPGPVELKGAVYAPHTIVGQAPLVILLHGRHVTCDSDQDALSWPCPAGAAEIPSYLGYAKLAENLASHGMVVVSIGANGINAADGYVDDGGAEARAQLVVKHLQLWQAWNASATGSPFADRFVGHIDLSDVGLMGHSRGGEGVVAAAQLNQRLGAPFGIKAVLALAPTDFGRRVLGGVPLQVILPYCDGDVSDLEGASYYDDSRYATPGDPAPKSTTLVYGANHNFFNTVWTTGPGSGDDAGGPIFQQAAPAVDTPDPCAPGGVGRLAAADQEQAGAVLMAGFFRLQLQHETGFQRLVTGTAPFPASTGATRWSVAYQAPDRLDVERFDRVDNLEVNRFGRLAEVHATAPGYVCNSSAGSGGGGGPSGTAPSPCSGFGSTIGSSSALDVGWVRPSAYLREPLAAAGTDVSAYDGLRFRVAVPDDSRNAARAAQDLSVVLEDLDGHRASVPVGGSTNGLRPLRPGFVAHIVRNGIRIPLDAFSGVDLTHVVAVELRFDRVIAGQLEVSDLAFTAEGTGRAVGPTSGPPAVPTVRPVCRRTESARWACTVAQLVWGRDPDPGELVWLRAGYGSAAGRDAAVARAVAAADATNLHARVFVQHYAQADLAGTDAISQLTRTGRATWEQAIVELAGNDGYGPHLQTSRQIVDALYLALTGRKADAGGMAYWLPKVNTGGATALAASLVRTGSYAGRVVDDRYLQILGHRPDPGGRAYWMAKLEKPGGEQALVRSLLGTETFRAYASS